MTVVECFPEKLRVNSIPDMGPPLPSSLQLWLCCSGYSVGTVCTQENSNYWWINVTLAMTHKSTHNTRGLPQPVSLESIQWHFMQSSVSCETKSFHTPVFHYWCETRSASLWAHGNLFRQVSRDGNLHGSGHVTTHDCLSKTIPNSTSTINEILTKRIPLVHSRA